MNNLSYDEIFVNDNEIPINDNEIAKWLLLLNNNEEHIKKDIFPFLSHLIDKDKSFSNIKILNQNYFDTDIDIKLLFDCLLLYNSCLQNNIKKVEKLLKNIHYVPDIFGNTPLFYAVINNYYELTILLLENGLNINHRDCFGRTVLHIVSREGNKYMINLLLHYGADQYIKDYFLRYPIIVAFIYKNDSVIEEFLLNGFKVHEKLDNNNMTILHLATIYGSTNIVKLILRYKYKNIYINDKTIKEGLTPLHLAIGKDEIFNLLLKNGAYSNISNNNGFSVEQLSKNNLKIF